MRKSTATLASIIFLLVFYSNALASTNYLLSQKDSLMSNNYSKLELPFIENQGQIKDVSVKYYTNTFAGTVYISEKGDIIYDLIKTMPLPDKQERSRYLLKSEGEKPNQLDQAKSKSLRLAIRERLLSPIDFKVKGAIKSDTKINYFKGNKENWRPNISSWQGLNFEEVYEGITLKLKAYGKNIEKVFTVYPNSSVDRINIQIEGAKYLNIDKNGQLKIMTELGPVYMTKPVAYQEIEGQKKSIDIAYNIKKDSTYGFKVGKYNQTKPLVIDPLLASTFIGGDATHDMDWPTAIAVSSTGNIYIAGWTNSLDFPTTTGAYDETYNGSEDPYGDHDVFVAMFNSDLTQLIASTFIGGSKGEQAYDLAINSSGDIYVVGATSSTDFPIPEEDGVYLGYDSHNDGSDSFIAKLDDGLTTLLYATFLGGYNGATIKSIAIDPADWVYVAGGTSGSTFPTTAGAYDETSNGSTDVFVSKFYKNLTHLMASTLIGGSGGDEVSALAINSFGDVFVVGSTQSSDFPMLSDLDSPLGYDTTHNGSWDVFVSKFNGSLTMVSASTFIGGEYNERAVAITIDPYHPDGVDDIYITGNTNSQNYPTSPSAYDETYNYETGYGPDDVFISRLDKDLQYLLLSTYIGGNRHDIATGIVIDPSRNIYITGYTQSEDFPTTTEAYDTFFGGSYDAFISKLTHELSELSSSTFIGGVYEDLPHDIVLNSSGDIYITGITEYSDYPTTANAYDTEGIHYDAFVTKIDNNLSSTTPPTADAGTNQAVNVGNVVTLDGSGSSDPDGDPLTFSWAITSVPSGSTATLSNPTLVNPSFTADVAGTYIVSLMVNDGTVDSAVDTVTISTINVAPIADAGDDQSVNVAGTVTLDGSGSSDPDGNPLTFSWAFTSTASGSTATLDNPASVNPSFTADVAGTYIVSLTVNDGNVDSAVDTVTISTINVAPIADAGDDQSVNVAGTVTLDGSGSSDPDGNPLTFSWAFTSTASGSTATLDNPASVNPSFTADVAGTYIVSLTVNDGTIDSAVDTVTISTINVAPIADAGDDQSVNVGGTVTLDGSTSWDPDGNPLTFSWAFTSTPSGSTAAIDNPTLVNPSFTADVAGTYIVSLMVNDGTVDSAVDTVTISTINVAPIADAGDDQSVNVGGTVTLDGSGSSDPDGNPLTFSWAFTSAPSGSTATLDNPTLVNPSFTADVAGTYIVSLLVNDGTVNSDADKVTISAVTQQTEAISKVQDGIIAINEIAPETFNNPNNKKTLTSKLNTVISKLENGEYQDAQKKLENDILSKIDGCALTGSPDKNDWINDCDAQALIYPLVVDVIELLKQQLM